MANALCPPREVRLRGEPGVGHVKKHLWCIRNDDGQHGVIQNQWGNIFSHFLYLAHDNLACGPLYRKGCSRNLEKYRRKIQRPDIAAILVFAMHN